MASNVEFSPSQNKGRPGPIQAVGSVPTTQPGGVCGTATTTGITVEEFGSNLDRMTVFTLTNVPLTFTKTTYDYASVQIYDFPLGRIHIQDCVGYIQMTTTSAIASTLNSGATVSWGVGTAVASSITLATTMMNAMPGSGESVNTFTSSTTINVAATADTGMLAAVSAAHLAAIVNGTSTAADLYLNFAVPTTTELDATATTTVSGSLYLSWKNTGVIT